MVSIIALAIAGAAVLGSVLALLYVARCAREGKRIAEVAKTYADRAEAAAQRAQAARERATVARDKVYFNSKPNLADIECWREQQSKVLGL